MAYRIPNSDTTTSSTTGWDTVLNTPTLHATTNVSVNTTARFTATFTAPNTTNKCTGVLFYMVTVGNFDWKVTLQESTVDTAATVTTTAANLSASNNWIYFRFPTPYTFTTTTAGAYRFKIQGITGPTASSAAADSGGLLYAFMATYDATGALGSSDILHVQGENGRTTTRTVTVDDTRTVGTYGDTALMIQRTLGNSINISTGGLFSFSTAASTNTALTCKGNVNITGGEFRMGNLSTPMPTTSTAKLIIDAAVSGNHGVKQWTGAKFSVYGAYVPTYRKSLYVSGVGTAVSPLVLADPVDWNVGDEVIITSTGSSATNYQETELKFIKTKVSSTTYTLSDTSGGAESAFTYTHSTSAYVLHLTRNCVITGSSSALAWYFQGIDGDSTATNHVNVGLRVEYCGNATSGKEGFRIGIAGSVAQVDDLVVYKYSYIGFYPLTSKAAQTFNRVYVVKGNTASTVGGIQTSSSNNYTFADCAVIGNNRCGILLSSAYNITFNDCIINANNTVGSGVTVATAGLLVQNSSCFVNRARINANRNMGVTLSNSSFATVFTDCNFGTIANNSVDINLLTDTLDGGLFTNCTFGSTTPILGETILSSGSLISFHKYNATDNNHIWYTAGGYAQSTGAGLADTNVRTTGSLGVRITPESNTDGFSWTFNIPAKANSIVNFFGWFQKNATLGTDPAVVNLYLPGASTPAVTKTLDSITTWQAAVLSAANTQTTDGLATIEVNVKSVASGAYLYCDDFYNAGDTMTNSDKVTGLDTWYKGQPVSIITPQATSAADIWNFPTANLTVTGTTGKIMTDQALTQNLIKDGLS